MASEASADVACSKSRISQRREEEAAELSEFHGANSYSRSNSSPSAAVSALCRTPEKGPRSLRHRAPCPGQKADRGDDSASGSCLTPDQVQDFLLPVTQGFRPQLSALTVGGSEPVNF